MPQSLMKLLINSYYNHSVNDLESEDNKLEFVKAFRELIRLKNVLTTFSDFKWEDFKMEEQQFEDFKSKYLVLYDGTKKETEKVSILDDVDFELELIHRDEINVTYIIQLLIKLKSQNKKDTSGVEKEIFNLLNTEITLRSKRELIEKFISESLPVIEDYLFEEREPLRDEVLLLRNEGRPSILKAKSVGDKMLKRINDFVTTLINGMNLS